MHCRLSCTWLIRHFPECSHALWASGSRTYAFALIARGQDSAFGLRLSYAPDQDASEYYYEWRFGTR
ncbi:hypothetical protein BC938DRAFT_481178 [Jimgerdemannia flammicorona]|uniref:Uncharacterized protein n=1 Tax=Jimgerdemannia flammicorona TaxID=994334 RepID=A0A433QX88_9FUNG|nr:hypothetical protein BC938DRAFT_481178 [Jimgerdemannia flammicorona]